MPENNTLELDLKIEDLVVLPYRPADDKIAPDALVTLWRRLKDEELWNIVFHENSSMTLLEFMNFFNGPQTFLQIIGLVKDKTNLVDVVGMAWLSDVTFVEGGLTKGIGSFVCFRKFQTPKITALFGEKVLDFWFKTLKVDCVTGLTPETNRPAILFLKRNGFKELCRIPRFTAFRGEICDAIISHQTREDYEGVAKA